MPGKKRKATGDQLKKALKSKSKGGDPEEASCAPELTAAVFGHSGTLKSLFSLLGSGEHAFVAATCKSWRTGYRKALEGKQTKEPLGGNVTTYQAVFASASRLRLAVEQGFRIDEEDDCDLSSAAGEFADLGTLKLAVSQIRFSALAGWKQQHGDKGRVKETGEALLVPGRKARKLSKRSAPPESFASR